ncbi:NUDIX domain-containing protein [Rhodovibrionaceae bacterium A322]
MTEDQTKSPSFHQIVPEGDTVARDVCRDCGFVHYINPKVVVGSVATWQGKILLCRRAIEPRKGYWTLPAGYLEQGESPEAGARREAREEACTDLELEQLLAVYSIERLSQVQLIYRARLVDGKFDAGEESLEVGLFAWEDIPWQDLAFPSVHWALQHHKKSVQQAVFAPFSNPTAQKGHMEELPS